MEGQYSQYSSNRATADGERQALLQNGYSHAAYFQSLDNADLISKKKQRKKNLIRLQIYIVALMIVFIGTFCIINIMLVLPRSEEYVNKSVEMDIHHISLGRVSTKGLNVNVQGSNTVNYDSIDDGYFKRMFKIGGGIFRTADINIDPVEIQTVVDDQLISIGTVDVPTFKVNIGNQATTELDLIVTIHPSTRKILGLVKDLVNHPDKIFKIYGSTILKITLGVLPIGSFKIDFDQDIMGRNYFEFNGEAMNFENLQIVQYGDGYDVDFTLSLPNPIKDRLFAFHVPSLGWELLVEDCFRKPAISLFDHVIVTDAFKISPLDDILSVNISTAISKLDPALLDICLDDDMPTPLTTLVDEFVNNKSLPVMVRNVEGSEEFPSFINEILRNIEYSFTYRSNFNTERIVHNVSIDHMTFEFQNGDINKPIVNGEISLYLSLPHGLTDVKINSIRGFPVLYHQGSEFGKINLDDWHPCENTYQDDYLFIKFKLNQEQIIITNKEVLGKVMNEIFRTGSSKIFIDALLDCLIGSLLGEFEIDKIHAQTDSDITRGVLIKGLSSRL